MSEIDDKAVKPKAKKGVETAQDASVEILGYTIFIESPIEIGVNGVQRRLEKGEQGVSLEVYHVLQNAGLIKEEA